MSPTITLIAAMANHRVIGIDNRLPWGLPEDLKHFRRMTMGKPVMMGRKTWDSIGRPLPGRHNIVVSRQPELQIDGASVVGSIEAGVAAAGEVPEVMVMGGASFYQQLLPQATRMVLTLIDLEVMGDAWFPAWNPAEWRELSTEEHHAASEPSYSYRFVELVRVERA